MSTMSIGEQKHAGTYNPDRVHGTLGFAGSLRRGSVNTSLCRAA
jgi:hypothetical protein